MKLLALNSGGIDSPVAMHMMLENGFDVEAVVFDLQPFTDEEDVETALETVERLEERHDTGIRATVVPHGFVQERFLDEAGEDEAKYNCLFSRRMMLRTAERLARERDCEGLLTGESLGQVASQTLDNLAVTGEAVEMQVYRPLIGLDKVEIVDRAKEAGTYEVSTRGGIACAAVVDYPETHGVIEEMRSIEERFDVERMVEKGVEEAEVVET
ncbi:MAG: 7-cyano-7-deazaguanine synthase [Candidatus Nanohaloarchaea archaeon]